jgi:hypothetical protein
MDAREFMIANEKDRRGPTSGCTVEDHVRFPPFVGYDDGCDYCAHHKDAVAGVHCKRGEAFGYSQCGTNDHQESNAH